VRVDSRWHPFEVGLESTDRRKSRRQKQGPRFREESARYAEPIPSRELLLAKIQQAGYR
jgi:hypothetical protein